ncbi:MAG: DUF6265 family protein [Candidatus Acidiferrales bacterium]
MTRTATARAFANMLVAFALFPSTAAFPLRTRAQQPKGVGTFEAPSAQLPAPEAVLKSAPPPAVTKATLSQFSWLAGHWQGQWGPRLAQQAWMPPHSGVMVGIFQLSDNSKTLVLELYSIVSTPHGIELRVRRFTPSLAHWEKLGPTLLSLESIDSKLIVFENADDGQPKSWLMRRSGADSFIQRFEIVPQKGQPQVNEIVYHRQPVPAATAH